MMETVTPCLIRWLSIQGYTQDPSSLSQFLHRVDPSHFNESWVNQTSEDDPRLKSLIHQRVLHRITDFYAQKLNVRLSGAFPIPNSQRVSDGDLEDTGRMLQLVLGCAVNCENKHRYIEVIMSMEESLQRVIMTAIQELMALPECRQEDERLLQRIHELENKIEVLTDEKNALLRSDSRKNGGIANKDDDDDDDDDDEDELLIKQPNRYKKHQELLKIQIELKKEIESLQTQIASLESTKDEYQVKIEMLEKRVEDATRREMELQKFADEARKLKDEVDVLKEYSEKAVKYEASVETYKKRMEEMSDLKRRVKGLEEKNTQYVQKNLDLEEELRKTGSWKPQVEIYKKQISELNTKLDSETQKADKLDFECKKLMEKLESLSLERDRLQTERDRLKERNKDLNDEIKMSAITSSSSTQSSSSSSSSRHLDNPLDEPPESAILEDIPSNVKERIIKLQRENKRLKGRGENDNDEDEIVLRAMIDDLKERQTQLQSSNRKANQRILELESKLEEQSDFLPETAEMRRKVTEANKIITSLNASLQKKDAEITAMEERYKRYIEKAKAVIKTLDPSKGLSGTGGEVTALRVQLQDKEKVIEDMEHDGEKARVVKEMEERLMASAFYNLGIQLNRSSVETRLSNIPHQPSSFLAKQRQVTSSSASSSRKGFHSSDFSEY